MQALYLFDYSKIPGDYVDYVFKIAIQALSNKGRCRFNHGDGSRLNAKELSACARASKGRLLQASSVTDTTPLTNADTEFTGGMYFVGMWTDEKQNIDLVHAAFNKSAVEGYIGMIEFTDPEFNEETWFATMRQQLHLLDSRQRLTSLYGRGEIGPGLGLIP